MYKFEEPTFETKSEKNFLPPKLIKKLLKAYKATQKYVNQKFGKRCKLSELFLYPHYDYEPTIKICYVKNPPQIEEIEIPTLEIVYKVNKDLVKFFEDKFSTPDKKVSVFKLCIHNLVTPLTVHCDGCDITNRTDSRPNNMNQFTDTHKPIVNGDPYNQGLITLANDNPHSGVVVFNQWFPISTYIIQLRNYQGIDTGIEDKPLIKFFKREKWSRFGEHIRHATNLPLSENDWSFLLQNTENPAQLRRDAFFGLTIDDICFFGKPGTINAWANKKYHASLPTLEWKKDSTRINLQFETVAERK